MTRAKIDMVWDLETIQDRELLDDNFPRDKFAHPSAHEIVDISVATFKRDAFPSDEILEIQSLGSARGNEVEMLSGFVKFMEKKRPRLVGFNSRGFDLEVIKYRCFKHGIQFPTYFQTGTKWDSYRSRYSPDWHLDIMDFLSSYGASQKFSLDLASRAIGLPGKIGISGADVGRYFLEGRHDEIRNYCEVDVVETSALMLRLFHLTGELSTNGFKKSAEIFLDFLHKEALEKPHIQEFLDLLDHDRFKGVQMSLEDNINQGASNTVTKFPKATHRESL